MLSPLSQLLDVDNLSYTASQLFKTSLGNTVRPCLRIRSENRGGNDFTVERLLGISKALGSTPSVGNEKALLLCLWLCPCSAFLSHVKKSLSLEPVKEVKLMLIPELVYG